jgi:hypothetical protein
MRARTNRFPSFPISHITALIGRYYPSTSHPQRHYQAQLSRGKVRIGVTYLNIHWPRPSRVVSGHDVGPHLDELPHPLSAVCRFRRTPPHMMWQECGFSFSTDRSQVTYRILEELYDDVFLQGGPAMVMGIGSSGTNGGLTRPVADCEVYALQSTHIQDTRG